MAFSQLNLTLKKSYLVKVKDNCPESHVEQHVNYIDSIQDLTCVKNVFIIAIKT